MTATPDPATPSVTAVERTVRHCYSTWGETYYDEYYGPDAPYPPVHRDLVRRELAAHPRRGSLLDAGCGPASMLRDLLDLGYDPCGFDLTPEMVAEGRRVLAARGLEGERIWEGSILDPAAFRGGPHAAVLSIGVLPHVPESEDATVLRNVHDALEPGGLALVQARNALFALFTLNRISHDFVRGTLMDADALRRTAGPEAGALDAALADMARLFRMDLPPVRGGKQGEPGYDEVLSRAHNPLVLQRQFTAAGFVDVEVLFYHFHALPPMFRDAVPTLFRSASLALEADPADWRGHFLASGFFVRARRP